MASKFSLSLLPDEPLVRIFSFLDSKDLILSLSLTCKRFHEIIASVWYWRRRYEENYSGKAFSSSPVGATRDDEGKELKEMQRGGVRGDYLRDACRFESERMHFEILQASAGGLDCVHIIHPQSFGTETMVAAGSRDHRIYLWKKRDVQASSSSSRSMRKYTTAELRGHKGWVWCLATCPDVPNVLCSGSWDHTVTLWDIRLQQEMFSISKRHKAAILGVAFPERQLILTSSSDKHVRGFDLRDRDGSSPFRGGLYVRQPDVIGEHSKAVLCVAASGNYVYSGSEDRTVKLWDRRNLNEVLAKSKYDSSVTDICCNEEILSIAAGTTIYFVDKELTPISGLMGFVLITWKMKVSCGDWAQFVHIMACGG